MYAEVRAHGDPAAGHRWWVQGRERLLRDHPASPVPASARSSYPGGRYGPYDPRLRFRAGIDTDVAPCRLEIATGTDGVVPFDRIGTLRLPIGDLDVWWLGSYGGGVFVPIKDASAGRATYGGGRYLLDTVKGADLGGDPSTGLVVDLNFAYNPSCAYDPAWACPLAPPGNTVGAAIDVGELAVPGDVHV
ncbi:DUF1684 domain-containing protein [Phytoactinopolyspora halotolerans]|uniref:DUF1684 domain-containing protein n=1 Tax=Phytoactinopolyspora halotolerans TaxID=1981512 RepID=UPI001C203674|nr:DUF1684 domain-containing protein [Phytoactinopolyspora halotolerans]